MVLLKSSLFAKHAKRASKNMKGMFIDSLRLAVKGGHGGNGLPKYGGVGGQGGCVYFIATPDVTLTKVIKKYPDKRIVGGHGEESSKLRLLGRRGEDRRIEVPVGVTILDNDKVIGDLNDEKSHCIVAGGGGGGCSGNSFIGHRGEEKVVTLDLKLIADVGLVGFPNAGKSTLLKAISNASPKIASYPFTTIRPQLGMINYDDLRQISVADLPGLIEGAHANIGMGHKFLKHIERTRLLLMVVDIFGFQLSPSHPHRSCIENVFALNKELEMYDETLFKKPCVLLLNKIDENVNNQIDVTGLIKKLNHLDEWSHECPEQMMPKQFLNFQRIVQISAKNNLRIDDAKNAVRDVLDEHAERLRAEEEEVARSTLIPEQLKVKVS